jgi:hypothetical protein
MRICNYLTFFDQFSSSDSSLLRETSDTSCCIVRGLLDMLACCQNHLFLLFCFLSVSVHITQMQMQLSLLYCTLERVARLIERERDDSISREYSMNVATGVCGLWFTVKIFCAVGSSVMDMPYAIIPKNMCQNIKYNTRYDSLSITLHVCWNTICSAPETR